MWHWWWYNRWWQWIIILPKVGSSLSSARAASISPNLDPVLRGANLDFCVNQVWISAWNKFVFNCEANLNFIGNQVFLFTLFKILLNIVNVSKRNPVPSWRPEKIWFLAAYPCILNQSLVSSVASHGKQDLRRKSFRFLSQCLSDFCEISVKICSPWNSGISLGKKMGKTVLPACGSFPNWEHTIHVHSVIFGRECK